jgi:hypothetical protein
MSDHVTARRRRTVGAWAAFVLLVPAFVALAVTMFTWPNARLEPRDLPIGVVGSPAAVATVTAQLARQPGAFEVHIYGSERAARQAIEERDVYGAIVTEGAGQPPTVLTAPAASPAVASVLTRLGDGQARAAGEPFARVVDVVPTAPGDPRGLLLGASVFPLMLAGLVSGALAYYLTRSLPGRLLGVLVASAAAGVVVTLIMQTWLDGLAGNWFANAGVLALVTASIASVVCGLASLFRQAGVALAGVLFMLVGNPASGMTSAPELLPQWFAAVGQLLPLGAGGQLVRSVSFFDGNALGGPLAVLLVWFGVGVALTVARPLAVAVRRRTQPATLERERAFSPA